MNHFNPGDFLSVDTMYLAVQDFNGGMPTHDFKKGHYYKYKGYSFSIYDSAYILGFESICSSEPVLWWWYEFEDTPNIAQYLSMTQIK